MNMELIERLETRFDELILRVRQLEEDNLALMAQVESEAGKRREVQDRIEALLVKVQASLGGQ
jgi:cell division protein ZapB